MKKNVIFFAGAVALIGAGAYFFFKNKKKTENESLASTGANMPSTSLSGNVNAEQLAEAISTKQEIKDLASSIKSKKDEIIRLQAKVKIPTSTFSGGILNLPSTGNYAYKKQISEIQKTIDSDLARLNELGYTELNGSPIKIG